MGRRIDGRFTATDDFNLDGHHIIGMTFLEDLPQGGAAVGETLVWNGDQWAPGAGGAGIVHWDSIEGKPLTFDPSPHVHSYTGLNTTLQHTLDFFVGAVHGTPVVDVTSDGVDIVLILTGTPTTLVLLFNSSSAGAVGFNTLTADSVVLTAGTDSVPVLNYVWIPSDTLVLTVGSEWPTGIDYVPIATVYCQSAASAQTYGMYKVHAWTDHTHTPERQGHLGHLNAWVRTQPATWRSGAGATVTDGAGTFDIAVASGVVLQLHDHTYPAMTTVGGSEPLYVVNDSVTTFKRVANMAAELTDSVGGTLSNRYYSVVLWGVVSEDGADCKMMINLPSGSYGSASDAQADASGYSSYSIPIEFVGTGFLIARIVVRHQVAGSTFTEVELIDLRGTFPGGFAGGSSGGAGTGVTSVIAGTGIAVSAATGDVTISTSLVAGTFINLNGATIAVDSTSVASAVHNHTIANITDVGTNTQQFALNFIIDGIGAVLSQGDKGWVELNCDCVLDEFVVVCDTVGSMTLTIESATYAGHESGYSDVTGGADVTLTSDKKVRDSTLTGWTTAYNAGDFIKFGVGSASPANITRALLVMNFTKDWA